MIGFSLLHAGAEATFRYREGALQFPVMLLYLIWFGVLLASFSRLHWRSSRARLISTALTVWFVAAPFAGARCGIVVRDTVFRSRFTEYETAVRAMQSGTVPPVVPRLAYHITQPQGHQQVFFFWGRGFPVKHTVFVYSPTDPNADSSFARAWHHARPLAPNWYVAKD
jgi:hypothetical protein